MIKAKLKGYRRETFPGAVLLALTTAATPRLFKFGLVGISGLFVNSAILVLLVQRGHLPPPIGGGIATEIAIVSNFAIHDRWTFQDVRNRHSRHWFERAIRFNLSALGGLLVNVTVLTVLSSRFHLFYLIANIFAVGAGSLCNYILSSRFAWGMTDVNSSTSDDEQLPDLSKLNGESDLIATVSGR